MDSFSKWALGIVGTLSTAGIIGAVTILFTIQTQLAVLTTKMDSIEKQQQLFLLRSEGDAMRADIKRVEDRLDRMENRNAK